MSTPYQRKNKRLTVNREFTSVDEFILEYVSNISRGGVFIRSKDPLPVGTRVNLEFHVVLEEIEKIKGMGEVKWIRRTSDQEGPAGMGVVFIELESYSRKLIENLLTGE